MTSPNIDQVVRLEWVFKLLVSLVAIFSLSLVLRPRRGVVDRPVSEDAYYALTVSRNIAEGKGATIDGSTPTNGFQPLFVFVCVPLYALAGHDKILAVRLVLGLSWMLYMGTAMVMGQTVRDFVGSSDERQARFAQWIAASLYLSAPLLFLQHFNGLETQESRLRGAENHRKDAHPHGMCVIEILCEILDPHPEGERWKQAYRN